MELRKVKPLIVQRTGTRPRVPKTCAESKGTVSSAAVLPSCLRSSTRKRFAAGAAVAFDAPRAFFPSDAEEPDSAFFFRVFFDFDCFVRAFFVVAIATSSGGKIFPRALRPAGRTARPVRKRARGAGAP